MAKPAYDVIIIGAGANSINEWIKSSWAENPLDSLVGGGHSG